jgi:poly-beta-hydroxybutyrate-responsive repressor
MAAEGQEAVAGALPRHYLKPCLLLLLAEGPSHGYELLEQVRRLGIQGAEPGGLYRYLRSMEKEELVSSWWEPSQSGPARRTYILTDAGRQALQASVDSLRDVRQLLVDLLDRYDSLSRGAEARSWP